ncbi:MAG TPA: alpha/beta hydrolase [Propionibacteriaceae bacterium]|nr:alpha/beta hydrolase [Propionibacteriaceae bacterium]
MDVILIPGLWLDGSVWDEVAAKLESYGLTPHAITLPGMESPEADRSKVDLDDVLSRIVSVLDECLGDVLVVGHSASCGLAYAVVDARPGSVTAVAYVGGFPTPNGRPVAKGFDVVGGSIPFPGIDTFDEADLRELDDAARDAFAKRAIPSPGCLATEGLELMDEARYTVPATMICPEYTSDELQAWIADGAESVSEIPKLEDVSYYDLGGGHWPMLTRPDALVRALLDAAGLEVWDDTDQMNANVEETDQGITPIA